MGKVNCPGDKVTIASDSFLNQLVFQFANDESQMGLSLVDSKAKELDKLEVELKEIDRISKV